MEYIFPDLRRSQEVTAFFYSKYYDLQKISGQIYFGRTYTDSPEIDGRVWIASAEALVEGTFVKVCVDGFVDGDLSGYLVEE